MIDSIRWVEDRMEDVPESLRERILAALMVARRHGGTGGRDGADASRFPLPDLFRSAARTTLEKVIEDGEKADPIDLLASDALITFACEAQAELDPKGLAEIR